MATLDQPMRAFLLNSGTESGPERGALLAAVFERSVRALGEVIPGASINLLAHAVSGRGDLEALATLVGDLVADAPEEAGPEYAYAAAILRGAAAKRAMLAESGGGLSGDQVGALLGISRQAVDKRRRTMGLLGVPLPSGDIRYPARQFTADGALPGLPEVLASFRLADPWMRLDLLLTRHPDLNNRTGFEALAAGDVETLTALVSSSGDQGR